MSVKKRPFKNKITNSDPAHSSTSSAPQELEEDETFDENLPKWYEKFKNDPIGDGDLKQNELDSLRNEAEKCLEDETQFYNKKKQKNSNADWIKTVLVKGTAGDKIAALVLTVQTSPVHTLSSLTSLVNMVKAGKKKVCTNVMDSLCELFVVDLLKPDVKLRRFIDQPLKQLNTLCDGNAFTRKVRLAHWLFEDRLKEHYQQFVNALDTIAKDTVEANREKAVSSMYYLLNAHPEIEDVLLKNIVNKIGDPSQKVASKVMYCLTQLLRFHPNMKGVVMNEIEKLLFRANVSLKTQYYCICFLSQFIFKNDDVELAKEIINIYFSFFKASVKKGEVDSRLMGALLMGVKRAYPFAKLEMGAGSVLSQHIDTLYKIVHLSSFNIALHTLCLLQQVSASDDRFYSALYKKLLDPDLSKSTHHAMLINLLYKSMSKDEHTDRVKALVKRLLQICFYLPVPLVCGILYMLSQLVGKKRPLQSFFGKAQYIYEENNDSDGEEKYIDADKQVEVGEEAVDVKTEEVEEKKPLLGWYYCGIDSNDANKLKKSSRYDPTARNPAYARAENSAYFELLTLTRHFHPTVALYAQKILDNSLIEYSGDPLNDFTLARFLERFVFKNPKKLGLTDGDSKGPDPQLAMRKYYRPTGIKAMSVTSSDYLKLSEGTVPVDEIFLFRFLKDKYGEAGVPKKQDDDEDDIDSVASEEFEEMIESLMGPKPKKELNYLEEIGDSLKSAKGKKGKAAEEEVSDEEEGSGEDEDEGTEESEGEDDADEGSDVSGLSDIGDDDEEDLDFSDEGGDLEEDLDFDEVYNEKSGPREKKKKDVPRQKIKGKIPKGNKSGLAGLFAPAEQFAELLEEAGAEGQKIGMAHSVVNKEKAAVKQLNWEAKRNRWVKGMGEHKRKRGFQNSGRNNRGRKKFKK